MKVVCIKDNWMKIDMETGAMVRSSDPPKKGRVYTVVNKQKLVKVWCYRLAEFPLNKAYQASHFRPITDISDLEKLCEVEPLKHVEPVS